MARKSILAFAAVGLLAAAGMVATALALGRFDGRLDPVLDALKGADAPDPGPLPALKLVDAFPKLRFDLPLWFGHDGTGSGWLYVVEQDGRIWRFRPEAETKELFLDLSTVVPERRRRHNEEGLLALAFHPKFKENRHFYVNYSQLKGTRPRRGVLSRFTASKDGQPTDPATEKVILEVEQPWGNHNGCSLNFGADGFLYASFGDGGAANDPHNHSQNLATLLGTVLRLDIDREENGKPYAVPRDNPFVGKDGARPEIWAYGLRNIWRMAFDAETGLLWGGDVGQNAFEEIDIIVKGGNYGWNRREGFAPFQNGEKAADMIDPVVDYPRDKGISVTGGVVYRGKVMEKLRGVYLYADYGSGRLWGVEYDHQEKKVKQHELLLHVRNAAISSFGEDPAGEVYVCGHHSGRIWRLEAEKVVDLQLAGKVVFLTGASGGIGRALARVFAAEGCRLALHAHANIAWLREFITAQNWQDRALALAADVADPDAVHAAMDAAAKHFGRVDICVANAGKWPQPDEMIHQISVSRMRHTIDVNLYGAIWTARAFFSHLKPRSDNHGASLTFIGSTAGRFGERGHVDYSLSKAGLYGLVRTLKNEITQLDPFGRVNMVEPGWTVTEMAREALDREGTIRRVVKTMPLRQLARAADIARVVAVLSSPAVSRHISGEVVTVAGGMEGRLLWGDNDIDEAAVRARARES